MEPNYPVYGTCLCLGFVVVFIEREKEEEGGGEEEEEEGKRAEQRGENTRNFKK